MLRRLIPLVSTLAGYKREWLKGDISAGLTVGIMLIPQGMAYAMIAGLPPIYGLYASFVPLIAYALLGGSRQLGVGPVAMDSLLVAAAIGPLADDPSTYISLALLLAFMVGLIQFVLGLAKAGYLVNFLSSPVLAGFTSAAALIIGFNQLRHLLGIEIGRSTYVHQIVRDAIANIADVHLATLLIGLAAIAAMVTMRRLRPGFPATLVVVAASTTTVWAMDLANAGVGIVGDVPSGLPALQLPDLNVASIRSLIPAAVTIALIAFMEAIAVAKVYARKHKYKLDPNQELKSLGIANMTGALFQAYPTTGGFSRTAVNDQAGANTTVSLLVSAAVIGLTLVALTDLFRFLPDAVLAAVVMVAVYKLVDIREAVYLWRVDRRDFWLMLVTFLSTSLLGITEGIVIGVVVSVALVVQQSSKPYTVVLGQLPGRRSYRSVERNPKVLVRPGIVVFRVDASLFFANVEHWTSKLAAIIESDRSTGAIVFDFYPVNSIDSTAVQALREVTEQLREAKIRFAVTGTKEPVRETLAKAGLDELIGAENFFVEIHDAVEAIGGDSS